MRKQNEKTDNEKKTLFLKKKIWKKKTNFFNLFAIWGEFLRLLFNLPQPKFCFKGGERGFLPQAARFFFSKLFILFQSLGSGELFMRLVIKFKNKRKLFKFLKSSNCAAVDKMGASWCARGWSIRHVLLHVCSLGEGLEVLKKILICDFFFFFVWYLGRAPIVSAILGSLSFDFRCLRQGYFFRAQCGSLGG